MVIFETPVCSPAKALQWAPAACLPVGALLSLSNIILHSICFADNIMWLHRIKPDIACMACCLGSACQRMRTAGSVSHIYRAVAQTFGIATEPPEEVLLLAEVQHGRVTELLTDLKAPAPEPFIPAFQTAQSQHTPHLLAYHYPSPAVGPLAPGLREVRVMHRQAFGDPCGPAQSIKPSDASTA